MSVLRFRIALEDIQPPVWRRIEVPAGYTFWDLHVAIQDAMGWQDNHLHEFTLTHPTAGESLRIGIPDDEFPDDRPTLPGWKVPVATHLGVPGAHARYVYDFGDDWHHTVVCEGAEPRRPRTRYPRCTDGARACPPEDVGGPPGYQEFLAVIADPEHEERARMLEWVGGRFDPEHFAPQNIRFDDPKARWKLAFGRR